MNDVKSVEKKRLYLYDNLKFLLILLVVLGHLIDGCTVKLFGKPAVDNGMPRAEVFSSIYIFIYAFHMPLFIFISGLFNRRGGDGKKAGQKALGFFVLGLLMKCLIYWSVVKFQTDFDKDESEDIYFSLIGADGVYWYLFAMAAFVGLCWILRNCKPAVVLFTSVLMALAVGYDPNVGDDFTLSRIIVFFPFYYCGYVLDPERVAAVVKRWYIRVLSVAVLGVWAYFAFARVKLVYPLRMLFTGRNSYSAISEATQSECTLWGRLLVMAIAAVLCFAVLGIGLDVKIPVITKCGSRTLQVFFWHRTIVCMLTYYGYQAHLARIYPERWELYLALTAIPITFVLCVKIFGIPLDWILKGIKCGNDKKENGKENGNGE